MVLDKQLSNLSQAENPPQNFSFEDTESKNTILNALNEQRSNQEFCDVILCCENREIPAHKPVLAAASSFFKDLLHEANNNSYPYIAVGDIDADVLEALVNFSYTAKLHLAADNVERLYLGARLAKFPKIEQACIEFQRSKIDALHWLLVWRFARKFGIQSLSEETEQFVRENFADVCFTKTFLHLPRLQLELVAKPFDSGDQTSADDVCQKVVDWVKTRIEDEMLTLKGLLEDNHMLYMSSEGKIKTCTVEELDDDAVGMQFSATEAQQQYIRQASVENSPVNQRPRTPSSPVRKDSHRKLSFPESSANGIYQSLDCENEFHLIAAMPQSDNCFVGLAILSGMMTVLSIAYQRKSASSCSVSTASSDSTDLEEPHWSLLAPMYRGRCSVGAAELGGKLFAVGGYNRGDCLDTMEIYDPLINEWQLGPALSSHRGRLGIATIGSKIYSVGGSDGNRELKTVECFDPNQGEWQKVHDMHLSRSQHGVAELHSQLYAVGGSSQNTILKSAEVYNPETNDWTMIASMSQPRENLCLASSMGKIYTLGGSTGWTCLNSVECYNPVENRWSFVAPMKNPRRGAGVAVVNGCLYVIGGSDGSSFLNTVECYHPETGSWVPVPSISMPRQNVGVAVVGECIYAVGGFSGQAFLNSIEYFDVRANKWNSYVASA